MNEGMNDSRKKSPARSRSGAGRTIASAFRPAWWLLGLVLDAALAMFVVSFSAGNILLIPMIVGICVGLGFETDSALLGLAAFIVFFVTVMIETRRDEDMQKDLSRYRTPPRPLFGSGR